MMVNVILGHSDDVDICRNVFFNDTFGYNELFDFIKREFIS